MLEHDCSFSQKIQAIHDTFTNLKPQTPHKRPFHPQPAPPPQIHLDQPPKLTINFNDQFSTLNTLLSSEISDLFHFFTDNISTFSQQLLEGLTTLPTDLTQLLQNQQEGATFEPKTDFVKTSFDELKEKIL
jgi:hypothetical protein